MGRVVYQGENKPDFHVEAWDEDKVADFSDVVTWRAIAVDEYGAVVVNDANPDVELIEPWKVRVRHTWTSAETARARRVYVEAEAVWPGGAKQTFRPVDNAYDIVPSGA